MKLPTSVLLTVSALSALGLLVHPGAFAQDGFLLDPDPRPVGEPANPTGAPDRQGEGVECTFIDFEGVGNHQPVGTVGGTPQVTFGPAWLGAIDSEAGGTGNFANEPSPDTAAAFLTPADPINFDTGVQFIEVSYTASAASLPVTLSAFDGPDGTGNVVATAVGNTVGSDFDGANCTGDPTGAYCLWDKLQLTTPGNEILSVTLEGAVENQIGFDDMLYCTAQPPSYVALGDSFSSGQGAGKYKPETNDIECLLVGSEGCIAWRTRNLCRRSRRAWTTERPGDKEEHALPGFMEMVHVSHACSGALIQDLETTSHHATEDDWSDSPGPQLNEAEVPGAELITLTIGGNDARFVDLITQCAWFGGECMDEPLPGYDGTLDEAVTAAIDDLRANRRLCKAYRAVKESSPGTPVIVVGYPRVIDKDGGDKGWSQTEATWARGKANDLWDVIKESALDAGVHWVDVREHFDDHLAGSSRIDWINGFELTDYRESYHPNKRGHREYAIAVQKGIDAIRETNPDLDNLPGLDETCGEPAALSAAAPPLPSLGELAVSAEISSGCGSQRAALVAGGGVYLRGLGFESAASVSVEMLLEDGTSIAVGTFAADASGVFEETATLPGSAPSSGSVLLRASGTAPSGGARLLFSYEALGASVSADGEGDGVPDICDNCPDAVNPGQEDTDDDGIGDACDVCPYDSEDDLDGDGVCDDVDPCVDVEDLFLQGDIVTSSRTESACNSVTATLYDVTSTGNVTFLAGDMIVLGDLFTVQEGGRFTAELGTP